METRKYKVQYSTDYNPSRKSWVNMKPLTVEISEKSAKNDKNLAVMKAIKKKLKSKKDFAWNFKRK